MKALIAGAETVDSGGRGAREPARIHAGGPKRAAIVQEIRRIARWYGWQAEVDHALATAGVSSLKGLPDDVLATLGARMRRLETCAQEGLDPEDFPPAR